jgi:molybdopterin/thiamine biosynthesis adenylyltransferase/rhodanese-related sulfurtransferase
MAELAAYNRRMVARVTEPLNRLTEIAPAEALRRLRRGALLIDVRNPDEHVVGDVEGSQAIPLASLEAQIDSIARDRRQEILTLCASGKRSMRAAETLARLGFENVASVAGGFSRWQAEGLPVTRGEFDADASERYSRHLLLPEVGAQGQKRLEQARVVLIGAGGLGSPAALYLAAAGVGTITLVDDDNVDKSNLQRQIVHTDARIGMAKTQSANIALSALNPRIAIRTETHRIRAENVERLLGGHDVIIDGADNFPTRYLLDAAARRLRIPLVYGAVHRFTGQVSMFDANRDESPCYRCLFPNPPGADEAPNCAEAGVLGVVPGIIGLLQATEAMKLILRIGTSLVGRLFCYDALASSFRELRLTRDPNCPGCGSSAQFRGYEDLVQLCSH